MKKLFLILLIIAGLLEGCKKYDEGPWLSLRSAKNRLQYNHTLVQYTVNGMDSLSQYNDSLSLEFTYYYNDIDYTDVYRIGSFRKDGLWSELYWTWELTDNNKILTIHKSNGEIGTGPFGQDKLPKWDILRLTNSEIKMKTNFNGKEYFVYLK